MPGFPPIPSGLEVEKFKEEEFPVVDISLQPRINRKAASKLEGTPSSERAGVRLQWWSGLLATREKTLGQTERH